MKSLLRVSLLAAVALLLIVGLRQPTDVAGAAPIESWSNICSDSPGQTGYPVIGATGIYAPACSTCTGPDQAYESNTCGQTGSQALPTECDGTNPNNGQQVSCSGPLDCLPGDSCDTTQGCCVHWGSWDIMSNPGGAAGTCMPTGQACNYPSSDTCPTSYTATQWDADANSACDSGGSACNDANGVCSGPTDCCGTLECMGLSSSALGRCNTCSSKYGQACPPATGLSSCGQWSCDGKTCVPPCNYNSDCQSGYVCSPGDGGPGCCVNACSLVCDNYSSTTCTNNNNLQCPAGFMCNGSCCCPGVGGGGDGDGECEGEDQWGTPEDGTSCGSPEEFWSGECGDDDSYDYCDENGCCVDGGNGEYDPILIDVSGDGYSLTSAADGVRFDMAGDGTPVQMAWTSAGSDDAFLALDRNGNGIIDNGAELFSTFTPQPQPAKGSVKNGWAALAVYDLPANGGNGDGWIDAHDAVYSKLLLWVDKNHNGKSEPGELFGLAQLGIVRINLNYTLNNWTDAYGNAFRYRSSVVHQNPYPGENDWAYDVLLQAQRQKQKNK